MVKNLSVLIIVVHAGKHPNVFRRPYGTLVEGEPSTTRFTSSCRQENKGGNPEYLQQQSQGAIANGVGEIPLNRKGVTATLLGVVKKQSTLI